MYAALTPQNKIKTRNEQSLTQISDVADP